MVEAFTLSFDGSKTVISREELHVDEALIVEVTMSLCGPEAACDVAAILDPRQDAETPKGQH